MKRGIFKNGKHFSGVLITAILLLGYGLQSAQALEPEPIVGPKVTPIVSMPVRDLPPAPPPTGEEVNPLQVDPEALPPLIPIPQTTIDPAVQLIQPIDNLLQLSTPIVNVLGQGGANPNDTNGDVGPNDYVQMINSQFRIYDKQGAPRGPARAISFLWTSADPTDTSECATQNAGDPIVLYDNLADRWLLSQFARELNPDGTRTGGGFLCFAISQTADPTGNYYLYQFQTVRFPDYFKIGAWPDGYYVSANLNGPNTAMANVYDRANMLNGNPAGSVEFEVPTLVNNLDALIPSDVDGKTNPPPGTPNFMYRQRDAAVAPGGIGVDRLELFALSVNWTTPGLSLLVGPIDIPITPFDSTTCGYVFPPLCIPQPGTGQLLDAIPYWGMYRLAYRNYGTHEVLAGNFTVDADGNDGIGIRWFILERSGPVAWSVANEGTYAPQPAGAPAFVHRWMGSVAMDRFGNFALGHSRSSAQDPDAATAGSGNPSAMYTGRLASDPLGLLPQPEFLIRQGLGVTGGNRWGDYYSMTVDPVDDCTFWYTGDSTNANGSRQSSIASFRFADCAADLAIEKSANPDPVLAGNGLFYNITVTNNGPIGAPDVEVVDTLPSGVDYMTDTDSCVEGPVGTLTCDLGDIANGDSVSFTIRVAVDADLAAAAGGPTTITNTATVSYDRPDLDDTNNEASVTTIVEESADLKVTKLCKPDGPLLAGETAICEIFVDNLGVSDARNVQLNDTHVANGAFTISSVTPSQGSCDAPVDGVVTCDLGILPANVPDNRAVVSLELTADEAVDINDTAIVSSDTPDPDTGNNMAMGSISVTALADLALTKEDSPDTVIAGETLTYTLEVTNNGPSTAVNVLIEDIVPAGTSIVSVSPAGSCNAGVPGDSTQPTTCTFDSLGVGDMGTMIIVVTVLPDTLGILHNDAQVSSATFDNNNANDLASTDTVVDSEADLVVTKTDSPDPVLAGAPLAYTIDVTNNGPSTSLDVMLSDTLPAAVSFDNANATNGGPCNFVVLDVVECELGDLAPGETVTVFINVTVDPAVPDGTTITNNVVVASSTTDPGGASASADTLVNAAADLWIDKTGNFPTGSASGTILYFLTVHNTSGCSEDDPQVCGDGGPSDALNIVVTDDLPSTKKKLPVEFVSEQCTYDSSAHEVTCTEPVLAAGDSVTFEIQVRAKGNLGEITNEVDVSSSTFDPDLGNNDDALLMTVQGGTGDSGGPGGGRGRGGGPKK